jgi:hypothetical protein
MEAMTNRIAGAARWSISRVADRAGGRGLAGLALLTVALLLVLHAAWSITTSPRWVGPGSDAAIAAGAVERPAMMSPSAVVATPYDRPLTRSELTQLLWHAAQRTRVHIEEVALGADAGGEAAGITAAVGLRGPYVSLKHFLGEVLNRNPRIAVGTLNVARKAGSSELEAQLFVRLIEPVVPASRTQR